VKTSISSTGVIAYFTDVLGCPAHVRSVALDLEHAARPESVYSATVTSIHRRRGQR
jgi:hypothetical protein